MAALRWMIVALCCVLPLAWLVFQLVVNPTTWRELHLDAFRLRLLGRTILYSGSIGFVSTLIALPAAWAMGRGRGKPVAGLWFVLPITLLMPSLVIAYGWKQFIRVIGFDFAPAGFLDVSRCVWSLSTWLWPVPGMLIGIALRRADAQVQQQALLDGVLWRVLFRQTLGPILASACVVSMLAMQEFAVYEPTGISVVATEVRMVFETGAYSSPDNPITQQFGFGASASLPDQPARAAAAIATMLPLLGVILVLGGVALLGARKLTAAENVETGDWPRSLDAPAAAIVGAWIVVLVALVVPMVALIASLGRRFDVARIWDEFSPQLIGSILIATAAGIVAAALGFGAVPRRSRALLLASLASFLIGGQLLAIALIRIYNRPWLDWVYNGLPIVVMAYIGRFGWIVLAAAGMTWSRPWRELRDLAATDGAGAIQTARCVIWPIAWPVLAAAALFVTILSLSEVPATVLISPQRPQMIVPMLMTWVHMLRYDAMIEASLLAAVVVVVLGTLAVALAALEVKRRRIRSAGRLASVLVAASACLVLAGCGGHGEPEAIWCSTGIGPGQVVYPRGITYSPIDDSFFIVDREARIQHLDHDGKSLLTWHTPEKQQGKPVGLTVGPDGNLWVPDTHYHRILVYKPDGAGPIRQFGEKGYGPGQFIYPTDIAFDSRGNIFVSEYGDNDRVQVFDPDFKFLYQFGKFGDGPEDFSRPQSMVIDGDLVYITDSCNHRLQVFKTDGTHVRTMGKVGSGLGEFRFPYGMDMDPRGRLVVCEFGNNRVQLIDKNTGKGLAAWGVAGREPGQLAYPWGVAVDRKGRVVAVDAGNNRLQVFEF